MIGEEVIVWSPTTTYDENMDEVIRWTPETVSDVLVDPSVGSDIESNIRLNGTKAVLRLHFPKSFNGSLRGCKVTVRNRDYRVIGDPAAYTDANTPTRWHMPADLEDVDG